MYYVFLLVVVVCGVVWVDLCGVVCVVVGCDVECVV